MTKRSVALAIHRAGPADPAGPAGLLLVQRPGDDAELPLAWGLPAASLRRGESWGDAVRRAARDKLGVDVEPGAVLGEGSVDRPSYRLEMRLYAARITSGDPAVPGRDPEVTQYRAWRWGGREDLEPAAERGSLCSRLYLGFMPSRPDPRRPP